MLRICSLLSSIFSKTQINESLPYDRKNSILPRVCSFIGSTNEGTFLNDETGSVRWLCFQIKKIDWDYSKNVNINSVRSQAFYLANNGFESDLNIKDIEDNEERNKLFQRFSVEQELISSYIKQSNEEDGIFSTASDILTYLQPLNNRLNIINR